MATSSHRYSRLVVVGIAISLTFVFAVGFVFLWFANQSPTRQVVLVNPKSFDVKQHSTGELLHPTVSSAVQDTGMTGAHVLKNITGLGDQVTDYYPLIIARNSPAPDLHINEWLEGIAKDRRLGNWPAHRGEVEVTELDPLLEQTTLSPEDLLKIGLAVFDTASHSTTSPFFGPTEPTATDELLALRFVIAAKNRACVDLARRTPPDPIAQSLIDVLHSTITSLDKESMWDDEADVYTELIRWAPPRSNEKYRDKYRLAGMLLESGKFQPALTKLDDLIAEVDRGEYPSPNQKDLAILRWRICLAGGWIDNGLQYFRRVTDQAKQTQDYFRLSSYLIEALVTAGKLDEAEQRIRDLPFNPQDSHEANTHKLMVQWITNAKWNKDHAADPVPGM